MADVFISYSRSDREIAVRLAMAIQAAGLSAWIDSEIKPGEKWRAIVQRELSAMHCMVVIWTPTAVASDHVIEEAAEGKTAGCLIPVQIGPCVLPYGFREIQSASLTGVDDPNREQIFHHIAERARELVQSRREASRATLNAPLSGSVPAPVAIGHQAGTALRRRDWLIGCAAASGLGVLGWAAWRRLGADGKADVMASESLDAGPAVPLEPAPPLRAGDKVRIAFTAAVHTPLFPSGAIWQQIKQAQPDLLVLLGNAMFLDVKPLPGGRHPRDMTDVEFQGHAFGRWSSLLRHPDFLALAALTPIKLLLGEHDYLWAQHAAEGATRNLKHAGKVASSRALFQQVRKSLGVPGQGAAFPNAATDAVLWTTNPPPPSYRHRLVNASTVLHVPDYQTFASDGAGLGAKQRSDIETNVRRWPEAVHLLASPLRIEENAWLRSLARGCRIVTLSGADHANSFHAGSNVRVINANASGAAIYKLVDVGAKCQNFAVLDIDPDALTFSFYSHGTPDSVGTWRLDRSNWTAASIG